MASSIRVDVPNALTASRNVGTEADDLRRELVRITREWDSVISGWSGVAASTYAALWEDWREGAEKLVETLARSSELLERAAVAYREQEATSTHAVQSIAAL